MSSDKFAVSFVTFHSLSVIYHMLSSTPLHFKRQIL